MRISVCESSGLVFANFGCRRVDVPEPRPQKFDEIHLGECGNTTPIVDSHRLRQVIRIAAGLESGHLQVCLRHGSKKTE